MQKPTTSSPSDEQRQQQHEKQFRISEIFGPTIQGEGALIGVKTHFIRFGGCDYHCSWCDSLYAVEADQVAKLPQMTSMQIVDEVVDLPSAPWVTLSGGNPALFDLSHIVKRLKSYGYKIAVETQGTAFRGWLNDCNLITVSPKPPSSGNTTSEEVTKRFLKQLYYSLTGFDQVVLKVVVFSHEDFEYAKQMHLAFPGYQFWVQVGNQDVTPNLQPMDDVAHRMRLLDSLAWLSDKVLEDRDMDDVRVTPQLHTLIWGNARGV